MNKTNDFLTTLADEGRRGGRQEEKGEPESQRITADTQCLSTVLILRSEQENKKATALPQKGSQSTIPLKNIY